MTNLITHKQIHIYLLSTRLSNLNKYIILSLNKRFEIILFSFKISWRKKNNKKKVILYIYIYVYITTCTSRFINRKSNNKKVRDND